MSRSTIHRGVFRAEAAEYDRRLFLDQANHVRRDGT